MRPLHAPSRGWARPQNCTGFEYQQLCTSILGLYSRCTIISAQVDLIITRQNKTSRIVRPSARPPARPPARSCRRRSSTRSPACSPLSSPPPANPSCGFQHIHGSEFLSLANTYIYHIYINGSSLLTFIEPCRF